MPLQTATATGPCPEGYGEATHSAQSLTEHEQANLPPGKRQLFREEHCNLVDAGTRCNRSCNLDIPGKSWISKQNWNA